MQKRFEKIPHADDLRPEDAGQTMKSKSLSRMKQRLNMKDGDEHETDHTSTIGDFKDMYIAIRDLSAFPYGGAFHHGRMALIHDTQVNRK